MPSIGLGVESALSWQISIQRLISKQTGRLGRGVMSRMSAQVESEILQLSLAQARLRFYWEGHLVRCVVGLNNKLMFVHDWLFLSAGQVKGFSACADQMSEHESEPVRATISLVFSIATIAN